MVALVLHSRYQTLSPVCANIVYGFFFPEELIISDVICLVVGC